MSQEMSEGAGADKVSKVSGKVFCRALGCAWVCSACQTM